MQVDPTILNCLDNSKLHLILMPTESCNFRCSYCYEDFKLKRMEPWVVKSLKILLSRRAGQLEQLEVSWFGGEPLLARGVIEDILKHIGSLKKKHPSLQIHSDMTTNGFLLEKLTFHRLVNLGVRNFQISIDGPSWIHDRKRVLINGNGTFEKIWGNLQSMASTDQQFSVVIRLHIDKENYTSIGDFLKKFQIEFGDDSRFTVFARHIARLGGLNDATLPVFGITDARKKVNLLKRNFPKVRFEPFPANGKNSICYAARGNSFLIRADGRLNKCTVALESPVNQIGRLLPNGRVRIDDSKMKDWMRGVFNVNRRDLECPWKGFRDLKPPPPDLTLTPQKKTIPPQRSLK